MFFLLQVLLPFESMDRVQNKYLTLPVILLDKCQINRRTCTKNALFSISFWLLAYHFDSLCCACFHALLELICLKDLSVCLKLSLICQQVGLSCRKHYFICQRREGEKCFMLHTWKTVTFRPCLDP